MRKFISVETGLKKEKLRSLLLTYCNRSYHSCFFESNGYEEDKHSSYDCIAATGTKDATLSSYKKAGKDWLFGYISYDHKNSLEDLSSKNFDGLGFEEQLFFVPEFIFFLKENELRVD